VIDLRVDRLARQPASVRGLAHQAVHFGRDDDLVAIGEVAQRAADDLFAAAG
jgi:hypothetical protein